MTYIIFGLIIATAYLLGSIPFALIITKLSGKGDIRKVGSGNIGATNVMRIGGVKLAGLVWLLDMGKAIAAILLGRWISGDIVFGAWCGFFAIVGHNYPIWLGFKGGKGNSSTFGFMLAINPLMFVICGIQWLIVTLSTGYSSLGALVEFATLVLLGFAMDWRIGIVCSVVVALNLWRHRGNIQRLLNGSEDKIKWKWKK